MDIKIKDLAVQTARMVAVARYLRVNTEVDTHVLERLCNASSVVVLPRWVNGVQHGWYFEPYNSAEHDGMLAFRVFGDGQVMNRPNHVTY